MASSKKQFLFGQLFRKTIKTPQTLGTVGFYLFSLDLIKKCHRINNSFYWLPLEHWNTVGTPLEHRVLNHSLYLSLCVPVFHRKERKFVVQKFSDSSQLDRIKNNKKYNQCVSVLEVSDEFVGTLEHIGITPRNPSGSGVPLGVPVFQALGTPISQ